MVHIEGIAASRGIAIAKAYMLTSPDLTYEKHSITNPGSEIKRFHHVLQKAELEIIQMKEKLEAKTDTEHASILDAQILMLKDPDFIHPITEMIHLQKVMAEEAIEVITNGFIQKFNQLEDPYMKERIADILDVKRRILAHLLEVNIPSPAFIDEEVILIAQDVTPSDTAQFDTNFIKGFSTEIGGPTSHAAIMARALDIPAIVGADNLMESISHGDEIIIDSENDKVIISPTEKERIFYQERREKYMQRKQALQAYKDVPSVTKDGLSIEIAGNINHPSDIDLVLQNGGDGIGLYRTEFLFLDKRKLPTENEQFSAYQYVLEQMKGKPVVVRTMDIGGDKQLTHLPFKEELNPFLGERAIRFSLANESIFRTQLRALLRSSIYGTLKIMFPMVATLEEFRQAKAILLDEQRNLKNEGIPVSDKVEVGIMVEIPSTAIIANQFAKEVDFFSIGTNDLIQYTMAADRMNEQTAHLYQPFHPAVIQLINNVTEAANQYGKRVGMCGEMAGDERFIPILLGLGLDEFSMSAASILHTRALIKQLSSEELRVAKQEILRMGTAKEMETYTNHLFKQQANSD